MSDTPHNNTMAVVLMEDGSLSVNNTTKHCLLHTVQVLVPKQGMHTVLPHSGSHKIDNFCNQLAQVISAGGSKVKKRSPPVTITEEPLVTTLVVNQFFEGALSVVDFSMLLEKRLLNETNGDFDVEAVHRACWNVYHIERRADIAFPRWFSDECSYRLWLIFNTVLEPAPHTGMPVKSVNEILKRLVELCGYTWNPNYEYSEKEMLEYPEYLEAITRYFDRFELDTSLTCEVIQDMRDEIVDGVLKKGYLTKKGHKRRNWKKRWFVLQRTIMRYYESRERQVLKGQLVLNGNTEVKSMADKGKRMYCFEVTCGKTGVPFEICSDDQRSKHEWMLAIKKAIALAQILEGSAKQDDFTESLAGFYLLKYGTPQPKLMRQDSTVRNMKFQATIARQRKRLSGKKHSLPTVGEDSPRSRGSSLDDQDEYIEVRPAGDISSEGSSAEDEDGYLHMTPGQSILESYGNMSFGPQSLPVGMGSGFLASEGDKVRLKPKSPTMPTRSERGFTMDSGFELKEEPEVDESTDSDQSYQDVDLGPMNSKGDLMDDELPNGYVHLVKKKKKKKKGKEEVAMTPEEGVETKKMEEEEVQSPMKDTPPTEAPPTEAPPTDAPLSIEDKEVEELTKKKLRNSLSLDENELTIPRNGAASPNRYLTIIHGQFDVPRSQTEVGMSKPNKPPAENVDSGPPVPPRKKSSPVPNSTPPPVSPRQFNYSMKPVSPSDDAPPTPPPRPAHTLSNRMASSPTLPGSRVSHSGGNTFLKSPNSLSSIDEAHLQTTPTDSTHNALKTHPAIPNLPPKS